MTPKLKYIILFGGESIKSSKKNYPVKHAVSSSRKNRVLDVDEVFPEFKKQRYNYNESILAAEYDLPYPPGLPLGSYLNMWPLFGLSHAPAEQERLKGYKKALQILSRTGP